MVSTHSAEQTQTTVLVAIALTDSEETHKSDVKDLNVPLMKNAPTTWHVETNVVKIHATVALLPFVM